MYHYWYKLARATPFSTDMNWPQGLLNIFNIARNYDQNVSLESRYYGPYTSLLNYTLVDGFFSFFVSPQITRDDDSPFEVPDPVVSLVVFNWEHKPVLFAQIKYDAWANNSSTCLKADTLIRNQYDDILFDCPIPQLYGLSLLGTSLRIYCGDTITGRVTPNPIDLPNGKYDLPHNFLVGEWDLDILSLDGLKKMQQIIAYIKMEAANIMG